MRLHKVAECDIRRLKRHLFVNTTSFSPLIFTFRTGTREQHTEIAKFEKLFYLMIGWKGNDLGVLCLCHEHRW